MGGATSDLCLSLGQSSPMAAVAAQLTNAFNLLPDRVLRTIRCEGTHQPLVRPELRHRVARRLGNAARRGDERHQRGHRVSHRCSASTTTRRWPSGRPCSASSTATCICQRCAEEL